MSQVVTATPGTPVLLTTRRGRRSYAGSPSPTPTGVMSLVSVCIRRCDLLTDSGDLPVAAGTREVERVSEEERKSENQW